MTNSRAFLPISSLKSFHCALKLVIAIPLAPDSADYYYTSQSTDFEGYMRLFMPPDQEFKCRWVLPHLGDQFIEFNRKIIDQSRGYKLLPLHYQGESKLQMECFFLKRQPLTALRPPNKNYGCL